MQNFRTYGKAPFTVAVIHGGPGAGGEMAPVARELSKIRGVLEPIQTADSLEGQIEEMKMVLEHHARTPAVVIGFSWGAWLSFIVAARYPALIKKLLMIGSGPFEEKYVPLIQETRLSRLRHEEKREFNDAIRGLADPGIKDKNALLNRLSVLTSKTDAYDRVAVETDASDLINPDANIFHNVWEAASEFRRSGKLLDLAKRITCPVIAIHGDYDPHPAEGVQKPLAPVLKEYFRFVLLEKCGHVPWQERQAKQHFYGVIKQELE